jgi:hypothetical protein
LGRESEWYDEEQGSAGKRAHGTSPGKGTTGDGRRPPGADIRRLDGWRSLTTPHGPARLLRPVAAGVSSAGGRGIPQASPGPRCYAAASAANASVISLFLLCVLIQ